MLRKKLASLLAVTGALALVMAFVLSSATASGGPVFRFEKWIDQPGGASAPGEIFTVTLKVIEEPGLAGYGASVPFSLKDPLQLLAQYTVITPTITAPAYWDEGLATIVWDDTLAQGEGMKEISFQIMVNPGYSIAATEVYSNKVYVYLNPVVSATLAGLGSLPVGSLPGAVPGALPHGELPAGATAGTWNNYTLVPPPASFTLSPDQAATTPYAIQVYNLTLTNDSASADTYNLSDSSTLGWAAQYPLAITLDAGASASVIVTVEVPFATTNWVTETTVLTVVSQNTSVSKNWTLKTWTGGTWDGSKYVGCRFDVNNNGVIDAATDVQSVSGRYNTAAPLYDYNHTGLIDAAQDVQAVSGRYNQTCPTP